MKKIVIIFGVFLSTQVWATKDLNMDKFSGFLSESINSATSSLNEDLTADDSDEMIYFRRFMVRLKAKFGIEVPWIASFTVNPEVEMVFLREYPEGFETYKP